MILFLLIAVFIRFRDSVPPKFSILFKQSPLPPKDADIVLWTDNPLSVYAKVKQTYVDGICLYDSKKDLILREVIKKERARLVQKMIKENESGGKTQKPANIHEDIYKCGSNRKGS